MKESGLFIIIFSLCFSSYAQITVDKSSPFDNPVYLIDNVLLGGGIVASNHSYEGDTMQIGFFNASNTSLGIDSGIVMATGDIANLVPGGLGSFLNPPNIVSDPDLLNVANSVPGLIGQSFTVSSINDVAKLEFDFIPTSDTITFRYVFGSQEYFAFENTQYNDVFGFFLSGPGISGSFSSPAFHPNGSINLAIVPGSNPPLPITISSVNSVTPINQQYFVDNTGGLDTIADADGMTTVLTATAVVQCGELYHIRLAIADGSDQGLSSYVWLEAGSFQSPVLHVTNDLGLDSSYVEIPCNSSIALIADGGQGATYQWVDEEGYIIGVDSFVVVGPGKYLVTATSFGCSVMSDTITIDADTPPSFDLGTDLTIPCNTTVVLDPVITGGTGIYQYIWSNGSDNSSIVVDEGLYYLTIDDGTGCLSIDSIFITEDNPPTTIVSGGGAICEDGSTVDIEFYYDGLIPWDLTYSNGSLITSVAGINIPYYTLITDKSGVYFSVEVKDVNGCLSLLLDSAVVVTYPLPVAEIYPDEVIIYEGETIFLNVGDFQFYEWYNAQDSLLSFFPELEVSTAGQYYVYVIDNNGCSDTSELALVNTVPFTEVFVPNTFTPNGDFHNETFEIYGANIMSFHMNIVNRWGEIIYSTTEMNKFWDGKFQGRRVPEGNYFYTIDITGKDKNSFTKLGYVEVIH